MRAATTLVIAAVICVNAPAAEAHYCQSSTGIWTVNPIPVYLDGSIDDDICPNSTCSDFADVERTLKAVLAEFYWASGGAIRFNYVGESACYAAGDTIPGAIHVYSLPCSGSYEAQTVADGDGVPPFARIRMCSTNNGSTPVHWVTYSAQEGISFHAGLMHELGHAVGLDHVEDCHTSPYPNDSIMTANWDASGSPHLKYTDLNFLDDNYVPASLTISRHYSEDNGLTWTEATNYSPPEMVDVRGRIASDTTAIGGTDLFYAWTSYGALGEVQVYRYVNSVYTHLGSFSIVAPYHPAVARQNNSVVWVGYQQLFNSNTHLQKVYTRKTTNGGGSWNTAVEASDTNTRTRNAGAAVAYDPVSQKSIVMWRGSGGYYSSLLYMVEGSSTVYVLQEPGGGDALSSDAPSIACGDPWVVGTENCLIAWTSTASWGRTVKWTQGHVSGSQIVIPVSNVVKTHPYSTAGSATVSFAYGSTYASSLPWHIALNQGGQTTYMWRKGPTHSSDFVDQRSFSESPLAGLPASSANSTGRRYTTVLDE